MAESNVNTTSRVAFADVCREPFRIFFPAAVLVGIAGVALWPLHYLHIVELYPGQNHARLMAYGLFGGFMWGFLGTAMPRMLSARPLQPIETLGLLILYLAMASALLLSKMMIGDVLFLAILILLSFILVRRIFQRRDLPPPGFVMVALALACAGGGAVLGIIQERVEITTFWSTLRQLLTYQGFVLLPILGVGAFILPRFFGRPSQHDFPESRTPPPGWLLKALTAIFAGLIIVFSFVLEAAGSYRLGPLLRLGATLVYVLLEIPVFQPAQTWTALSISLRVAFLMLLAGFLAIAFFPGLRISLLHLTLIGGFAVVTFTVATRVIFGHSGNQALLSNPNRWLLVALGLMLLAMATRISGDLWPKVMMSHYNYGALVWIAAVVLWGVYVLPKVLKPDPDK